MSLFNKVLLSRDKINYSDYESMPYTEYQQYIAVLNEMSKGEKHKQEIEKAKSKSKSKR